MNDYSFSKTYPVGAPTEPFLSLVLRQLDAIGCGVFHRNKKEYSDDFDDLDNDLLLLNPMNRSDAWNLLTEYNQDLFHILHAQVMEGVMKYFAVREGFADEAEFWGIVGLLHDLDFEQYPNEHCVRQQEIMAKRGVEPAIIRATASHGWKLTVDIQPEHRMEKILYATDELTGLIGAIALIRPSKSVQDMEVKSIAKKFKTPAFAAGCSRDVIRRGAELLDWTLDELFANTLEAMKSLE